MRLGPFRTVACKARVIDQAGLWTKNLGFVPHEVRLPSEARQSFASCLWTGVGVSMYKQFRILISDDSARVACCLISSVA